MGFEMASHSRFAEPIAIVGMGIRSPLGNTPIEFWTGLEQGVNAVGSIPTNRFDLEALKNATPYVAKDFQWRGGFLPDIDRWDPAFFDVPQREAAFIDPQQRLLLEVAWEAIEDMGVPPGDLSGKAVGVFVGCLYGDYEHILFRDPSKVEFHVHAGALRSSLSGRLSYFFGFEGPSLTVDAACTSSLAAVHLACQSLHTRECHFALAGGVNVILQPQASIAWARTDNLAPDGKIKFGDANANGMVRSEAAGLVVLKRLQDAQRDGDAIYAVIRGSAINHGGRRSSNMVVPSLTGQIDLVRDSISQAGIVPGDLQYVEAHGTGTRGGDYIELSALSQVLGEGRGSRPACRVGSVKTNLGHTESASGVLALIKTALSLKHECIAPSLNLTTPNPRLDWPNLPITIPTQVEQWPIVDTPRFAGVSSFGVSGTNAHIVLQQAQVDSSALPEVDSTHWPPAEALCVSARSQSSLVKQTSRYTAHLEVRQECWHDLAAQSQLGRTHFPRRVAVVAADAQHAAQLLSRYDASEEAPVVEGLFTGQPLDGRCIFVFTGQGSQYATMGSEFYRWNAAYRERFDLCSELFDRQCGVSPYKLLIAGERDNLVDALAIQSTLVTMQLSMLAMWDSLGVRPHAVIGHSLGEYAAAYAAGVMSLEDCIRLVSYRAKLIHDLPPTGSMVAVLGSVQAISQALLQAEPGISIAADNAPNEVVISGPSDQIQRFCEVLQRQGMRFVPLKVSHAMHSCCLDPVLDSFGQLAETLEMHPPKIAWYSTCLAKPFELDRVPGAVYWREQLRHTVRFREAVTALDLGVADQLIELGPSPVALGLVAKCGFANIPRRPTCSPNRGEWKTFLESVSQLYVAGQSIEWKALQSTARDRRVKLPFYSFDRESHWFGDPTVPSGWNIASNSSYRALTINSGKNKFVKRHYSLEKFPFLRDHQVLGDVVFPAAGFLDAVFSHVSDAQFASPVTLRNVQFKEAMVLRDGSEIVLRCDRSHRQSDADMIQVISQPVTSDDQSRAGELEHAELQVAESSAWPASITFDSVHGVEDLDELDVSVFYDQCHKIGLDYGARFRAVKRLWSRGSQAVALIELPESVDRGEFLFHPSFLDAVLQTGLATLGKLSACYMPLALDRITLAPLPPRIWCRAKRNGEATTEAWSADLELFDDQGTVVGMIQGLVYRATSKSQLSRATQSYLRNLYQIEWEEHPFAPSCRDADLLCLIDQEILNDQAQLMDALDRKVLTTIWDCLDVSNWTPGQQFSIATVMQRQGVLPRYRRLVTRMVEILAQSGIVEMDSRGDGGGRLKGEPLRPHEIQSPNSDAIEWILLSRCCERLTDVLTGQVEPLSLLFAADVPSAERLYRESLGARVCNARLKLQLSAIVRERGAVRVLEIGAGTGGTTASLLPVLSANCSYTFTDLSLAFLAVAREQFAEHHGVEYRILDIEKEPQSQGFNLHCFDVIIAANVLHATADMTQTMQNIRSLLADNGQLLMLETTDTLPWLDLTFGLLEGWWRFNDLQLRPGHALLSDPTWRKLLGGLGYASIESYPNPDAQNAIGAQAVITACAPRDNAIEQTASGHDWIVIGDGEQASLLRTSLESFGTCCWIQPHRQGSMADAKSIVVNFEDRNAFDSQWQRLSKERKWAGIVLLGSRDSNTHDATAPSQAIDERAIDEQRYLRITFEVARSLLSTATEPPPLYVITSDSQPIAEPVMSHVSDAGLVESAVWGLAKAARLERPDFRCVCIDTESNATAEATISLMVRELFSRVTDVRDGESQVAFRNGKRWVPRLLPYSKSELGRRLDLLPGDFQLHIGRRGTLEALELVEQASIPPQAHEIRVRVEAAGLNFRDVLNALDLYPGDPGPLGRECVGVVEQVGENVQAFAVGQRVMGLASGAFGSIVTSRADHFQVVPNDWDAVAAATIPAVGITAWLSLIRLAHLAPGEKVLIHSAAGGVGMIAVQLAQWIGAEVFATASQGKHSLLREQGIQHVYDSRTHDFSEAIRNDTQGGGVDVVLNSLSGQAIAESLKVLKTSGRFIELGKRGILSVEQVHATRPDVTYHTFALDESIVHQPEEVAEALAACVDAGRQSHIRPLPAIPYTLDRAPQAFRLMQQGQHTGKIILTIPPSTASVLSTDGVYLIVGGLGGLGLAVAQRLVELGARQLVLMGRSGPESTATAALERLRELGAKITWARADVANFDEVEAVVSNLDAPLRGVIHSAGVLRDGIMTQATWSDFQYVLGPKVRGAWNLHRLTKDKRLDFFVLFSSIAAVLGTPGQANHAAANAFLDSFVAYRRSRGLPATSINWGAWSQIGAAAGSEVARKMNARGIEGITPADGLDALQELMRRNVAQATVAAIDWTSHLATYPTSNLPSLLRNMTARRPEKVQPKSQAHMRELLAKATSQERPQLLRDYVRREVARLLGREFESLSDDQVGLQQMGMDSLMSIELRNRLQIELAPDVPLSPTMAFDYPNLASMIQYLQQHLFPQETTGTPETTTVSNPVVRVMQADLHADEPIAVLGIGCRLPGGVTDLQSLEELLFGGKTAIGEVPSTRWDFSTLLDESGNTPGKMYTRHAACLEGIDQFDASFFGISPREAVAMDPQQRLLLETTWEALENACIRPDQLFNTKSGVFIGMCGSDYSHVLTRSGYAGIDSYFATGTAHSVAAGRISYVLGLQGPSLAMDTACSSSLVALHGACESLRRRECHLAIAGGVNALLSPELTIDFCRAQMLARDGRCKPFSAEADGFVRGEGCGVIILKRLSDAIASGDRIQAVLRGSAINQDGRSSGLTAPNGPSQESVISESLARAGLSPRDVGYVEAHGTGTALGDPVEVLALSHAYADREQPLVIGSIKANIGHLEGAAGIAGVIKSIALLRRGEIPRQLHVDRLNSHIDWSGIPVTIARTNQAWTRSSAPRIAGVSSFGLSGTNAHVIIEESPRELESARSASQQPGADGSAGQIERLLVLSARCEDALQQLARRYQELLLVRDELDLDDVCFTANLGRTSLDYRVAFVFSSRQILLEQLAAFASGSRIRGVYSGRVQRIEADSALLNAATHSDALASSERPLNALATTFVSQYSVDWSWWQNRYAGRFVDLPTYPFQRKRFWPSEPAQAKRTERTESSLSRSGRLQGERLRIASREIVFETSLDPQLFPLLLEHRIQGHLVIPAAWYLAQIQAACQELWGTPCIHIHDLMVGEPLICVPDRPRTLQIVLTPAGQEYQLRICSLSPVEAVANADRDAVHNADNGAYRDQGNDTWIDHATAFVGPGNDHESSQLDWKLKDQRPGVESAPFYAQLTNDGVALGQSFQTIQRFWEEDGLVETQLRELAPFSNAIHPAGIDACFQSFGVALSQHSTSLVHVFQAVRNVNFFRVGIPTWCRAQLRSQEMGIATADVALANSAGELLLTMQGVQLRHVGATTSSKGYLSSELAEEFTKSTGTGLRFADRQSLAAHVHERIRSILDFEPSHRIDATDRFFEIGFDSMRAIELHMELENDLGLTLPAALAFQYPTLELLTDYISSRVLGKEESVAAVDLGEPEEDWSFEEIARALQAKVDEHN